MSVRIGVVEVTFVAITIMKNSFGVSMLVVIGWLVRVIIIIVIIAINERIMARNYFVGSIIVDTFVTA